MPNTRYRISAHRHATWLVSHGGFSHAQLAQFFKRSAGWVTHLLKKDWANCRLTPEQAHLMRTVYEWEKRRADLPKDIYQKVSSAQLKLGEAMAELDHVQNQFRQLEWNKHQWKFK